MAQPFFGWCYSENFAYEFKGLGKEGLRLLQAAKQEGPKDYHRGPSDLRRHVRGASASEAQSQKFRFLSIAKTGKPIPLQRGLSERIDEWCSPTSTFLVMAIQRSLWERASHVRKVHSQ